MNSPLASQQDFGDMKEMVAQYNAGNPSSTPDNCLNGASNELRKLGFPNLGCCVFGCKRYLREFSAAHERPMFIHDVTRDMVFISYCLAY
jgi:hypothetical protein